MEANFSRRDFLHGTGMSVAALAMTGCADNVKHVASETTTEKSNILLIVLDDQGWLDTMKYASPSFSLYSRTWIIFRPLNSLRFSL